MIHKSGVWDYVCTLMVKKHGNHQKSIEIYWFCIPSEIWIFEWLYYQLQCHVIYHCDRKRLLQECFDLANLYHWYFLHQYALLTSFPSEFKKKRQNWHYRLDNPDDSAPFNKSLQIQVTVWIHLYHLPGRLSELWTRRNRCHGGQESWRSEPPRRLSLF